MSFSLFEVFESKGKRNATKEYKVVCTFQFKDHTKIPNILKKQHYYLRLLKGIRTLVKLKVKVKLKEHIEITSRGKLVLVIYVYFIALFWIVHHI